VMPKGRCGPAYAISSGHIAGPRFAILTVVKPSTLVVVEEGRVEGRNAEDMSCRTEDGLGTHDG
jgi:hypothetical protein